MEEILVGFAAVSLSEEMGLVLVELDSDEKTTFVWLMGLELSTWFLILFAIHWYTQF